MASDYPGGLDSFDTIASDKKTSDAVGGRTHRAMHNDLGDAIEAVQTELGTDPAGASATVKARFEVIEANDWVTSARIAADAVGSSEIAANAVGSSELADNAVDTAAIADSAVTSAKIADGTITSADVAAGTFAAFGTVGNLLTSNQASVETDASGWVNGGGSPTIARSTAQAAHGSASLLVTATGTGAFQVNTSTRVAVDAGDVVTFRADLYAGSGSRTYQIGITFYNAASGGSVVPGGASSGLVAPSASWGARQVTATVPAGATHAALSVGSSAGSVGDSVYMDRASFHKGAGGQWALPGVPIVGQSHIASNGAVNLSGTGTPEGVVTAAPGSTWLQTDSTTTASGWLRWVKATGTGNTGWVAGADADTGQRVITATPTGWTSMATIMVRRIGRRVTVAFEGVCDTGGIGVIATLPTGFTHSEASTNITGSVGNSATGAPVSTSLVYIGYGNGDVKVYRTAGAATYGSVSFDTNDTWPSSLPGSAA